MSNPTQKPRRSWLNPDILKWAREWRGRTLEDAAAKLKKSPTQIEMWERGEGTPTVKQARMLADFYDRAFLEFFLPTAPVVPLPQLVPDYRMYANRPSPPNIRELRSIQQWMETQRDNALDLLSEIGESPREIPHTMFSTLSRDPGAEADKARSTIGFSIDEQMNLTKSGENQLPDILRARFEALGILTLRRNDLKPIGVRGICLAVFPLPVLAFSSEAPSAQAFTLVHEIAHVLVRSSGISGPREQVYESQPVEKWCDQFAAAFLMPTAAITAAVGARPRTPARSFSDDALALLAAKFRVSPHAMLIRLVNLGHVAPSYYWTEKKPQFDKEEREYKRFGRAAYYGSRYKSSLGDLYTGLVLDAWAAGRITNHNAAEFMGIRNLRHLQDIRDHFST